MLLKTSCLTIDGSMGRKALHLAPCPTLDRGQWDISADVFWTGTIEGNSVEDDKQSLKEVMSKLDVS